ncbi:MAG: hypothetical protein Q9168_008058, partial [Polycauliona sp. 1 TL-2023]
MSALLWKAFFENDLDQFRHLLANAVFTSSTTHPKSAGQSLTLFGTSAGSPGKYLGTSPNPLHRSKRGPSGVVSLAKGTRSQPCLELTRADVNIRDSSGRTLLHHIASSTSEDAIHFALALLDLSLLDLYAQDAENAWTALHRALYFGNIAIARALIDRDFRDAVGGNQHGAGLIKIKDLEGKSPFDVYGASIAGRNIQSSSVIPLLADNSDDDESPLAYGNSGDSSDEDARTKTLPPRINVHGDELFTFGSNKNFTLGFGDEDDRQYPERITLKRSDRLLNKLTEEHNGSKKTPIQARVSPGSSMSVPAVVQYRPILIQDVRLAKLHSAVLTNDPEANLYVCGFGPGGRLGTGDETTRFSFVPVTSGGLASRRVIDIGLGQNHTIIVTSQGEVFTWGNNSFGQLGYTLPSTKSRDEEPVQLAPKQVFGPLKRELVQGTAASRTHSVVYTSGSLYTFGKNDGQLGLVDSDARSLEAQTTPRRVAASLFSSSIYTVSAIDKATICLLENHDVWIFANYGYTKLTFPLDSSSDFVRNHFLSTRYNSVPNHICKITSGGDTICVMSNEGDVFSMNISQRVEAGSNNGSTTNPSKIRGALSAPWRIWTRKKGYMAVRDVDVGQDGSVIICTEAGSVWRRVKRAKVKDANAPLSAAYKPKDYKFSRVSGLTGIVAVRSNTFGAYAALRRDNNVLKKQLGLEPKSLWRDLHPLVPFSNLTPEEEDSETENPRPRFWAPSLPVGDTSTILQAVFYDANIEQSVARLLDQESHLGNSGYDMHIGTTSSEIRFPVHECILAARSATLSRAFSAFRTQYFFTIPNILTIEYDKDGRILVLFVGMDFLTMFNFVLYAYTDAVADVWLQTRHPSHVISRYRQVRSELMQIAVHLNMQTLEQSVRTQTRPARSLHEDLDRAIGESSFFDNGDVEIQLDGPNLKAHSSILCRRCPFFEGLFQGRAAGRWIDARRQQSQEVVQVDLKHLNSKVFDFARRHIYSDVGEGLFDCISCLDSDSFYDFILEVMSVANELMLERLSQCCQKVLGEYVETRNVCQLLNAVAPCSVTGFKQAALEYICLNLEGMLENQLLNELDEDLILELDTTVRQNQLARLPFAKSGRAEAELLESYPQLAEFIERGKRAKVDQIAFRSRSRLESSTASVIGRSGITAEEEDANRLPVAQRQAGDIFDHGSITRKSPKLLAERSTADLIFDMDDNDGKSSRTSIRQMLSEGFDYSLTPERRDQKSSPTAESPWLTSGLNTQSTIIKPSMSPNLGESRQSVVDDSGSPIISRQSQATVPWGSHAIDLEKLDMKTIMTQASSNNVSSISTGLSSLKPSSSSISRLTQRERKKQQQMAALQQSEDAPLPPVVEPHFEDIKSGSPWQIASAGARTSLKDILAADRETPSPSRSKADRSTSNPSLTLRQTVPGNTPTTKRVISEGPSKPHPIPAQRSTSTPNPSQEPNTPRRAASSSRTIPSQSPITIGPSNNNNTPTGNSKSIRHSSVPAITPEPSLQLSMADILNQQQTEKDVFKEAVAKRSLQEIQEEQAFQEWWDQESRKVMEEEEFLLASTATS